jgi:hypothetical protein
MDHILQSVNQHQLQNIFQQMLNEALWHRKLGSFAQFDIHYSKLIRDVPNDYSDYVEITMVKYDLNSISISIVLVRYDYKKKVKKDLTSFVDVLDYQEIRELVSEFK